MTLPITVVNCPTSLYAYKCPYAMTPTRIVVHNTANDASAMNEISYMLSNTNYVSYHYAVDDQRAVQGIPLNRNTFNAGDGATGAGNRQGIAIEICYSKSGGTSFTNAEKNGAKLVAMLLKQYGWGIDKVTKHQDYSGKYCPHRTLDLGWQRFVNMVQAELNALNGTTSQPTQPSTSTGSYEAYSGYVEVTYDGLTIRSKASWDASAAAGTVKKGEVFTVVGRQLVDGVYMYKLKSGKWITSAKEYVSYRTTLHGTTTSTPTKTLTQLANEVVAGEWGTGQDRINRLTQAGYDASAVQAEVNRLMAATAKKSNEQIAKEVVAGLWGNGQDRRNRLSQAGYNPDTIQAIVNTLM